MSEAAFQYPSERISVSGTKWKLDGNPFDGGGAKSAYPGDPPIWSLEPTFSQRVIEAMLMESLSEHSEYAIAVLRNDESGHSRSVWANIQFRS